MALQSRADCPCAICAHLTSGVCDKCHSSTCARAIWHGYMCNQEAQDRHRTTRRYQTQENPINFKVFRGED